MSEFKVNDRVETPLGIGNITFIGNWNIWVSIDEMPEIEFNKNCLKSYKSAHEKLIERGFEYSYRELGEEMCEKEHTFRHDKRHITIIVIVNGSSIGWYINFYDPYNYIADLELAKIIVQYLEENKLKKEEMRK